MTTSAKAKRDSAPAIKSTPVAVQAPALIAYHAMPTPKGQKSVLVPIGSAIEHPNGAGFTLNLQLMPTVGGQIILLKPQAQKPANETAAAGK